MIFAVGVVGVCVIIQMIPGSTHIQHDADALGVAMESLIWHPLHAWNVRADVDDVLG